MTGAAKDWKKRLKMKIKRILLLLDMASLQSSRTQCCCCAVGVFAAMFGVFMLSAGICIVVNVGMEVDTSGLPSNLHNDNGRRIVGIILICVAVATMALSASVGFVYFVVCNRKPVHTSLVSSAAEPGEAGGGRAGELVPQGKHRQHGHHHAGRNANGVIQQRGAGSPADGKHARLAPTPERSRSRDSVRSGSQQSLRSAVLLDAAGSGSGRPPGSRYHHHHKRPHHHHKSRGFRPGVSRYKSGLEPHMEEDVEAAKSIVDLKRTEGLGSNANTLTSTTATDLSRTDGYNSNGNTLTSTTSDVVNFQQEQAWSEDGRDAADLDRAQASAAFRPPAIVLNDAGVEEKRSPQAQLVKATPVMVDDGNSSVMEARLSRDGDSYEALQDTFNSTVRDVSYDGAHGSEHHQLHRSTQNQQSMSSADFTGTQDSRLFDGDSTATTDLTAFTAELDSLIHNESFGEQEPFDQHSSSKAHQSHSHTSSLLIHTDGKDSKNQHPVSVSSKLPPSGASVHPSSPPHNQVAYQPALLSTVPSVSSISSASSLSISSSQSSSANLATDGADILNADHPALLDKDSLSATAFTELGRFSEKKDKGNRRREGKDGQDDDSVELEPRRRRKHSDTHSRSQHKEGKGQRQKHGRVHQERETNAETASTLPQNAAQSDQSQRHATHTPSPQGQQSVSAAPPGTESASMGPGGSVPRYNPAFSSDGGDPDPEETADLRKMQEYMEHLMEESADV